MNRLANSSDADEQTPSGITYPHRTVTPSSRTVLSALSQVRLVELGRTFAISVPAEGTWDEQAEALTRSGLVPFRELLSAMRRDELRAACRAHGLDDSGHARSTLLERLHEAHGAVESAPRRPDFAANEIPRDAPHPGDIVRVRHRQWLVEDVVPPPVEGHATLVRLVCLDDDNQGKNLAIAWDLELGAKVVQPEAHGLGDIRAIDRPRHFAAYLHALKWSSVTATDAKLFQSPFRAGIKLMNHQLTPLRRALSLPRANVFIADDVGLGKTIEAGLIAQELLLRQRVEFILVVCPPSVCLQWRDEMQKRFGLRFEIMSRAFVSRRRQERGFGVNPWGTHTRFIVSYPILRRPEYRDPLLQHLGDRAKKSLLVLDEAHVAAPSGAGRYAVDSTTTTVIRDVAPRFENRMFLSATPHNGHSNSFSALLELLDPQRFTRGVKVREGQLDAIMVRRLKEDLRQLGIEQFPHRQLVQHAVGNASSPELRLAAMLAKYTAAMKPARGDGALVFINLQKRLLSSVEAFLRTLQVHHRAVLDGRAKVVLQLSLAQDDDEYGLTDDALERGTDANVDAASRQLVPTDSSRVLLEDMLKCAGEHRTLADAKIERLVNWIRENQCPAVALGGASAGASDADRSWSTRRVIIFTEYADTKRYLRALLDAAVDGTHQGSTRIMELHGGMSDEQREEVQRAFNSPPEKHPVRILLATDAAREGVNLQGHCADLFHFDVPWNPARIEQRNGRIDRTLQPEPVVRCHYFIYPDRPEDAVLQRLVEKVDTIRRELGSMGSVLLDRLDGVMHRGIDGKTATFLDAAANAVADRETSLREWESERADLARLNEEIEDAGQVLNRSRRVMDFDPVLLRDAIDVGLELTGASALQRSNDMGGVETWRLPLLGESWQETVDLLRPPRSRDEAFWEFRKKAPLPVVFRAPPTMTSDVTHLHLQHPFVARVLGRFLAQGFSAHDLSRVTVVRTRHDSLTRVIAFGRLSLFGTGATRLHDQLVSVAARWIDGRNDDLKPFAEEADRKAIELLEQVLAESPSLEGISSAVQKKLLAVSPRVFATLWKRVREEANELAHQAEQKLAQRGRAESEALHSVLFDQRKAILTEMGRRAQLTFDDLNFDEHEQDQFKREQAYMGDRVTAIELELEHEPKQIKGLYRVVLRRLEPVGLVFLWPETRG